MSVCRPRVLHGSLVLALCGTPVLAAAAATARADGVVELLVRARAGEPRDVERELAALGPAGAAEVFGLCSGRIARLGPMAPEERALLLATLRTWPADPVVEQLLAALPEDATLDDRLVLLGLVGEVGGRSAIAAMDSLCAGLTALEFALPLVTTEVERVFARLLWSDGAAFPEIRRRVEEDRLRPEFQRPVARALGEVGSGRAFPVLERLLGRSAALDLAVVEALGRLRPYDDPRVVLEAGRTLRRFLSSIHPELRRQAALALGSLRDAEAVPELAGLLDDADRRVQRGAHEALRRISGLDLSPAESTWLRWHEEERSWLEAEAPVRIADLSGADPARSIAALRILSTHPLFGSSFAEEIHALLDHPDPLLAVAACSALVKLDDVGAFAPLVDALDDEREPVQGAALRGLAALTGAALGSEPEAWRAWLDPSGC